MNKKQADISKTEGFKNIPQEANKTGKVAGRSGRRALRDD
ncbi:hypothetical protein ROD_48971 [Citrobacter rodentium ICC168]|uniref:Uncharacterized protein n=1 Tax=Citrobacter rodentium (strain ICC168) TaxID=637910 RepID=D2TRY3_CITRI|nr:hypothetical protein ROD_48971 [Citrobacter rodentium ICC168]